MAESDGGGGGYRKPPKHSQFVKGKSGNPRGRPRGSLGLKGDLNTVLGERIPHPETGKRLSRRQMIVRSLAARAVRGNVAAADKILNLEIAANGFEEVRTAGPTLSENDNLILAQFLGQPTSNASNHSVSEQPGPCDPTDTDEPDDNTDN